MSISKKVFNLFLCVILLVASFSCTNQQSEFNWNDIRPEVRADVELFQNLDRISARFVGIGGETPDECHILNAITQNATEKELVSLTDYPVGSIRAIALDALLKRPNTDQYKWIMKALNDTTGFFEIQVGCIKENMVTIGEYIIQNNSIVKIDSNYLPSSSVRSKKIFLTKEQVDNIELLYDERKKHKGKYYSDLYRNELVNVELD